MKLSKLFCSDSRFKDITFNLRGLSIIYADVLTDPKERKNSHDLGKTKLAELIDYLLIKKIDKNNFLLKVLDADNKPVFRSHIFYLEVLLNDGRYLTIKRSVESHTKTSISINEQRADGYEPPLNWVHEDLGIEVAKKKLAEYFKFDLFKNKEYDYRKAVNYCIRMQPDYEDVYRLSKFKGGKDIDWKPFMFDLLGFNGDVLRRKYRNDEKQERINDHIAQLKQDFSINNTDRDEIIAQIGLQESKTKDAESKIDQLNFYEQDKRMIESGIDEIENKISELNTLSYNLNFDINKLQSSIKNNISFDLNKVEKVFNESKLYFPTELKKDYADLLKFNEELTKDRNRLLRKTLKQKSEELQEVNDKLQTLNSKKEDLFSFLKDTDIFKKLKAYQKELARLESELIQLKEKLKVIDLIVAEDKKKEELKKDIEATVTEIKEISNHTEINEKYKLIRNQFSKYFSEVMDEDTYISWSINSNNNVDFKPPVIKTKGILSMDTAKDEGRTYRKILCVVFDLAILVANNEESYFRFVYHDDVLSQQDNGIKIRLLKLIQEITSKYDIQYILSVIKSDLPTDEEENPIYFSPDNVVLELNDKNPSGTLFGFEF
ncbi:hypothetical protein KO02_23090 [Sphingobacterium sp. ML3W]|uniref:DUF2326 domain-containing protein n=1 Tax=Sphingobacterium sp. ML3W TaxID=1538644 RepID=UPI0004F8952A|nr:DUF2326 domain-containing protein [Sphingobacterium sp. ML3W]AIM39250.1 hypothetical protein KO02_23090 [Sphingobacterium sp. ML3W]